MEDDTPTSSRRAFLLGAGAVVFAPSLLSACTSDEDAADQAPWLFGEFQQGSVESGFDESGLTPVDLPHCAASLSWWKWDPRSWNDLWVYRRHLRRPNPSQRTVLTFGGVLSAASVYLNGREFGRHTGGYLPFEFEVTDDLLDGDNVLAVVVDARWGLNAPPGRPEPWRPRSIDFYQPGGLSRPMTVRRLPKLFLTDVYAAPVDVLSPQRRVAVTGTLDARHAVADPVSVMARVVDGDRILAEATTVVPPGTATFALTLTDLAQVQLWDLDTPKLYNVRVSASVSGRVVHGHSVRIGFREARFELGGFYLNGHRVQLFGLNRHEWYPFVGAAMPDRVHRRDADILKNDLNCVMVRCSHYPQSEAFLDACDELGLLVWEEAPGWDYIGNTPWRHQVLQNVESMVVRDRHHPSIIVWGTRLNETEDDVALYSQTRSIADRHDGSRATTGAVNSTVVAQGPVIPGPYRDPFATTALVQDVFAFNDYLRPVRGELPTLREPRTDLPYLVSEAVGALVGPATFRRTDEEKVQAQQDVLHAAVHDKAMSDPRYCGLLAWCAFDYPSGYEHSVNGLKWPGVADIFREPKLGAAFYRAQVDPMRRVVIEPAFYWDSTLGAPGRGAMIWSNCERLDVFVGTARVATVAPDRALFPHLRYPPFVVDLPAGLPKVGDLRIDGWANGALVLSRSFSANRELDRLRLTVDDTRLVADGVDATRVAATVIDRHDVRRGFAGGVVSFSVDGPGDLVGDNPLDLTGNGGVGAVWLRTRLDRRGRIVLTVQHPGFDQRSVTVQAV